MSSLRKPIFFLGIPAFAAVFAFALRPVQGAPVAPASSEVSLSGIPSLEAVPAHAKQISKAAVKLTPKKAIGTQVVMESQSATATIAAAGQKMAPAGSCKSQNLKLVWPVTGTSGRQWAAMHYVDLDPSAGVLDFRGKTGDDADSYDGHRGYDIHAGSFRTMDNNTVMVRAAAAGTVIDVDDRNPDRNKECSGAQISNHVVLRHRNGFTSYYGHMKKGSAKVHLNDVVTAGQELGVVGSSGCSHHPQLYFQVSDCSNNAVEPAKEGMWPEPPQEKSGVLEVVLQVKPTADYSIPHEEIYDPKPNPTTMGKHDVVHVGLIGAYRGGDTVTVGLYTSKGPVRESSWTKDSPAYLFQAFSFDAYRLPGDYTGPVYISVFVNGKLNAIRMIMVQ